MMSLAPVHAFGSAIFRRQCVNCPSLEPSCSCPTGQICSLSLQTCTTCPVAKCISFGGGSQSGSSGASSKKSNAGPVAGGVIGGFFVLGILGFFLWRNMNKKRREKQLAAEKEASFGSSRAARTSTHTVASISSTTTRASNVIQIGYLPGVMNRSAPTTPGQFIPPVPPLPTNGTPEIRYPQSPDQGTFFSADDILRASVYTTGDHDPRASVATTIYRNNAIVSPVAANVVRLGKAAVVTVKGGHSVVSTPHLGSTPPVPPINPDNIPPSPAFSVGSTFLNKMSERNITGESKKDKDPGKLSVPRRLIPGRAITAEAVVVESSAWEEEEQEEEGKDVLDDGNKDHRRRTLTPDPTNGVDLGNSPFSDTASLSGMPLPAAAGLPPVITSTGVRTQRTLSTGIGKEQKGLESEPASASSTGSSGTSSNGKSPFDDANAVGRN